jgi:hypothetical protein
MWRGFLICGGAIFSWRNAATSRNERKTEEERAYYSFPPSL